MNGKFLNSILLIALTLVSTSCVNLKSASTLSAATISKLQTFLNNFKPKTEFGKKFVSSLLVKVKTGDKVDSLSNLVTDLENGLKEDQTNDDNIATEKNANWDKQINLLNSQIAELDLEIFKSENQLPVLQKEIDENRTKYEFYVEQTNILSRKTLELNQARTQDLTNYQIRSAKQKAMLEALNVIHSDLNGILDKNSFISKKEIIGDLKNIGKNNALKSLIQLTMTFDKQTVQDVITQISAIITSLEQSLAQDEEYETVATENFNKLIVEFENTKIYIEAQAEYYLSESQAAQIIYNELVAYITTLNATRVDLIKQRDEEIKKQIDFNALYNARKEARNTDINGINNAMQILSENSTQLKEKSNLSPI